MKKNNILLLLVRLLNCTKRLSTCWCWSGWTKFFNSENSIFVRKKSRFFGFKWREGLLENWIINEYKQKNIHSFNYFWVSFVIHWITYVKRNKKDNLIISFLFLLILVIDLKLFQKEIRIATYWQIWQQICGFEHNLFPISFVSIQICSAYH